MREIGSNLVAESLKVKSALPWIWLYHGTLEQTTLASPVFRLTSHDQEVTFLGKTYHPFPVTHELIPQDSEGNLPQCTLTLSNVAREFTRYMVTGKGMVGQAVVMTLVHASHLATGDGIPFNFEVKAATVTDQAIALALEMPNFYQVAFPFNLFTRNRCCWRYKSAECGYKGTLPECDKTLNGPMGCVVHGADELAHGIPVVHPRMYRAFPGIPEGQR